MKLKNHIVISVAAFLIAAASFVLQFAHQEKPKSIGGPSNFSEIGYPAASGQPYSAKEGWFVMTSKRGDYNTASTTGQGKVQNTGFGGVPRTLIVDRVIAVRSGTSSATFILNIGTTTDGMITYKNGASNNLIEKTVLYARATVTPLSAIASARWGTSTDPVLVIDNTSGASATTTANAAGSPYTDPSFDVDTYVSGINGTYLWNKGAFEWKPQEYLAWDLSRENYTNGCGRAGGDCTLYATSSGRGFDLDIFVHYVATSTFSQE